MTAPTPRPTTTGCCPAHSGIDRRIHATERDARQLKAQVAQTCETVQQLTTDVALLNQGIDHMSENVTAIRKAVNDLTDRRGDLWDRVVQSLITALVAASVTAVIAGWV